MKFTLDNKNRTQVSVNINKYRIDWDEKVSRGKNGQFGKFQKQVKDFLRPYWENYVVYEELKIPRSRLSLDLFNLTFRVAVEVQGRAHTDFVEFFHGNRIGFWNQKGRDVRKRRFCELNEIQLIEIFSLDDLNEKLLKKYNCL